MLPPESDSIRGRGGSPSADECATESLALKNPGRLTIGTDSPAFEPWFSDNDPSNGEGFESAVAYAVAEELGFSDDQVDWVKVPFNNKEVFVHTGDLSVETLKRLAGIPLTDDLDQLVGSKIVPLPDNSKVHVTGCEIFLHHPKDGGSS